MSLKLVTGALPDNDDVLTLAQFKSFLVDVPSSEDTEAQQAVDSAVEDLEKHTGRAYGARTYDLVFDSFPSVICLPKPPLTSVTSVKYIDSADAEQTLTVNVDYYVYGVDVVNINTYGTYGGWIEPVDSWPTDVNTEIKEAVTIRFVAGYDAPNTVPARAKQAARLRANLYYSFKGATYDQEADNLYWKIVNDLCVYSFA
jgi:uncharacterized phiE125 gp8 family phage protein